MREVDITFQEKGKKEKRNCQWNKIGGPPAFTFLVDQKLKSSQI